MIFLLYQIAMLLVDRYLSIAGFFSKKNNEWNKLRKSHFISLASSPNTEQSVIWIHCASLGEYLQIKPLIVEIINEDTSAKIWVSFFSPSGYENVHDHDLVDNFFYLPVDTAMNMKRLVKAIKPRVFIGVKYELWWNLLRELHEVGVPIVYTNFFLKDNHYLKNRLFHSFLPVLRRCSQIFTLDDSTFSYLQLHDFKSISRSGDMRIDQVQINVDHQPKLDCDLKIMVWGSVYDYEIDLIKSGLLNNSIDKHIIVPHNVDNENIDNFVSSIRDAVIYPNDGKIVIVNQIGLLKYLYSQATICYVGGGFIGKLHNVLEAAVYRIGLITGPKINNYPEAIELHKLGILNLVDKLDTDSMKLNKIIDLVITTDYTARINTFFDKNKGSTAKVVQYLKKNNYI